MILLYFVLVIMEIQIIILMLANAWNPQMGVWYNASSSSLAISPPGKVVMQYDYGTSSDERVRTYFINNKIFICCTTTTNVSFSICIKLKSIYIIISRMPYIIIHYHLSVWSNCK
jgi:hypothetical protein